MCLFKWQKYLWKGRISTCPDPEISRPAVSSGKLDNLGFARRISLERSEAKQMKRRSHPASSGGSYQTGDA